MSLENYHGKLYLDYIADIKIARAEIKNMKLYPTEAVICDIYALPSHNFQAYYAMFYERNGRMQILYAKPQIYHRQYAEPVKMYTFSTNRKVKNRSVYDGRDGRIIIGMKYLSDKSAEMIKNIIRNLPETWILEENMVVILDGVFQAIRVFDGDAVIKEVVYQTADRIPFKDQQELMAQQLENLYLLIGEIIGENPCNFLDRKSI